MQLPLIPHRLSPIFGLSALCLALVAACGGGGSSSTPTPSPVTFGGVAATGAAISGGAVSVQCAAGSGTTTTDASGNYSLTLANATLPCMIRATDPVTNQALFSTLPTGSTVANITPITDLVTANALGLDLSTTFNSFGSTAATNLSAARVTAAKALVKAAIQSAMPDADVGSDDPMTVSFTPAMGDTAGDNHDKKLDALMAALTASGKSLADLRTPLQTATTSTSGAGSITTVVGTAANGLAGCPVARSGDYWAVNASTGQLSERTVDFSAMTIRMVDDSAPTAAVPTGTNGSLVVPPYVATIVTHPIQATVGTPCQYRSLPPATSNNYGYAQLSASGVSVWRNQFDTTTNTGATVGIVVNAGLAFRKQPLELASLAGTWDLIRYTTVAPATTMSAQFARLIVAANGSASMETCTGTPFVCTTTGTTITLAKNANGSFSLTESGSATVSTLVAHKSPNGDMAMLVTRTPAGGISGTGMTIGSKRMNAMVLPKVGDVYKNWGGTVQSSGSVNASQSTFTIGAVNTANKSFTRTFTSSIAVDTMYLDSPATHWVSRPAVATPVALVSTIRIGGKGWSAVTATDQANAHLYLDIRQQ